MSYREITIVKTAFDKVKEHFHVPVILKDITSEGKSIILIYNEVKDGVATGVNYSQSFSPY